MKTKRKFTQITYEERIKVEVLLREGRSLRYIATVLGRSPNTVAYEVKKKVQGVYIAKKAHHKSYYRRYLAKKQCMKLAQEHELAKEVEIWIKNKWSPERISGYLYVERNVVCSKKAIYKYVRSRCLEHLLFCKGKKRKVTTAYRKCLPDLSKQNISARPPVCESGHLEVDFIVSSHNTACLLVCVDRLTRYTRIFLLPNRKHATVLRAFQKLCRETKVISITTDNDIAFRHWRQLELVLTVTFYFCAPYHSWEKGLVENTNRWIRVFFPKKADLQKITEKEL
jgi:IS30 family transposase